ncbi:hypothetical protein GCM10008101_17090 [Lysobacter xinjiangensis]|uniref:Stress-induced protein n=1 Tax=Cognatilysobacter xinjiangensis TaxID=546892 RepID=A0ABQ3C0V4_9GAMM|nr:hypothetical protein [Lysobacter xinjiangensis]GGZ64091.1 hypothetical protein GCM10008101_17090 [Lysobacter xinjiangensis]
MNRNDQNAQGRNGNGSHTQSMQGRERDQGTQAMQGASRHGSQQGSDSRRGEGSSNASRSGSSG